MDDPYDETRFADARDVPALDRENRRLHDEAFDDDDDFADRIVRRTRYPAIMLVTGILWILAGAAYIALFGLLRLMSVPFQSGDIWLILGAVFFVRDGVELIRGKFGDPLWHAVYSLGVGCYFSSKAYFHSAGDPVAFVIDGFFAMIFLGPGLLVLLGRRQYLAWRTDQEV